LAENGRKVYVITNRDTLVVMDNEKREKLHEIPLTDIKQWVVNTGDSRIYLADGAGRVCCLKPIEY